MKKFPMSFYNKNEFYDPECVFDAVMGQKWKFTSLMNAKMLDLRQTFLHNSTENGKSELRVIALSDVLALINISEYQRRSDSKKFHSGDAFVGVS